MHYNRLLQPILIWSLALLLFSSCRRSAVPPELQLGLTRPSAIEVGGPFVGVEFHHSYMRPQRLSFYYPVANSLDRSQDYWSRDTSFVMQWALKIDGMALPEVGLKPTEVKLAPYAANFQQRWPGCQLTVTYRFCETKPALVVKYTLKNTSRRAARFAFTTELATILRTCHTYKPVAPIGFTCSADRQTVIFTYTDPDVRQATLFLANAAELPVRVCPTDSGLTSCNLTYEKELAGMAELEIMQIIGSAYSNETPQLVSTLLADYTAELDRFEQRVKNKSWQASVLESNVPAADFSAAWAKAVLETNRHYLDGHLVPMPCPAEYNFYFTHDVLVTDLSAVHFDLERVRQDLEFIAYLADRDGTIPHAYYWKDGRYQTELAGSDNWNNQWFIILTGSYLRHSGDRELVVRLFPLLQRSLTNALHNREADNLIWGRHPDWWDIGNNYGPRAYMTILTLKALQEYNYIALILGQDLARLPAYHQLAQAMQAALVTKLWSDSLGFLMNYNADGRLDEHYYAGSLLAAHYGLLDAAKTQQLVATARERLLVDALGIHIAYPPDFHQWGDYYHFVGNEVGAPYYYLNGGIWPNGNAWYALALLAGGEKKAAADFIQRTMAITGISRSPNGQPAYYEVRSPNPASPELYGAVDKPQFMWAAGWYLYCLYQLFGVADGAGNIGLRPQLAGQFKTASFTLFVNGQPLLVKVEGQRAAFERLRYDGQDYPSAVFPLELPAGHTVEAITGTPRYPYLQATSAILQACRSSASELVLDFVSWVGLPNTTVIISPRLPREVTLNGKALSNCWTVHKFRRWYQLTIGFTHMTNADRLTIRF